MPKSQSSEVDRISKYTLMILSTIEPITTTFTVKGIARLVRSNISPQLVAFKGSTIPVADLRMKIELFVANQVAVAVA